MEDDCFHRIVVGELFELVHHSGRRDNDAFQVHNRNLVAERAAQRCPLAGVQSNIDQRKYHHHKQEKDASSDDDPQQRAGAFSVVGHGWDECNTVSSLQFPVRWRGRRLGPES